ncbi:MAG: hypothetical protein IT269_09520 [Saprospiraceae bacterium]|nr:hypothetical protein [Saprospiraceae bacterium]
MENLLMNDRFWRILLHPYLLVFCCIATFAQHGRSQTDSLPAPAKPQVIPPTVFATYNPAQDPMLNPPPMPCQLTQDARDEFTGNNIRQTAFAELFRNSNPALRNFLQGKPHIVGQVALLANGS